MKIIVHKYTTVTVSRFCMEQIPFIFPTAREESLVVILSHIASTPHFFTFYWVGRGSWQY